MTNWTLVDRKVNMKIPVGVAYGTDVGPVMESRISCGEPNPMVLIQHQSFLCSVNDTAVVQVMDRAIT